VVVVADSFQDNVLLQFRLPRKLSGVNANLFVDCLSLPCFVWYLSPNRLEELTSLAAGLEDAIIFFLCYFHSLI
jgi:hypothetical protein